MKVNTEQVAMVVSSVVLALSLAAGVVIVVVGGGSQPGPIFNAQAVPEAYRSLIIAAGGRCPDISAPLLAAQIEVESNWNPNAVSPSGAQGLAQFTPGTWAAYGLDGDRDGRADPFNPADAIPSQASYLCAIVPDVASVATQSGIPVVDLVLAAYHDGPGAVARAGGIPSTVARNYVAAVERLVPKYTTLASVRTNSSTGWRDPIDGPYTRGTGFWVPGPLWKWKGHHTGVDFVASTGTRIVAAGPGTISAIENVGSYGMHITINDGTIDGVRIQTLYAHMSRFADVAVGQSVQAGDLIGYVGATGNVTGPHLHFEVHQNWAGGNDNAEFLDGFAWIDAHRGAPRPNIAQEPGLGPHGLGPPAPLDGDNGPPPS